MTTASRDDVSLLPRSMIACGRWWTKVIAASIFSGAATAKRTRRSRARRSSSEVHSRRIGDRDQDRAVGELADGQRGEAAGELLAQEHGRLGLTSDHVELDKGSSDSSARRRQRQLGGPKESALDEQLAQPPAGNALLTREALPNQDSLEIAFAHELVAYEKRSEGGPRLEGLPSHHSVVGWHRTHLCRPVDRPIIPPSRCPST